MLYRNVANETIINVHVTNVILIKLIDSAELLWPYNLSGYQSWYDAFWIAKVLQLTRYQLTRTIYRLRWHGTVYLMASAVGHWDHRYGDKVCFFSRHCGSRPPRCRRHDDIAIRSFAGRHAWRLPLVSAQRVPSPDSTINGVCAWFFQNFENSLKPNS